MRHHVEAETARRIATGEDPTTARRRAAAEFGSVDARIEEMCENRPEYRIEQAWQYLRYATRNLCKAPGFAAAAVLSLDLAIGANPAMFSLFDEVFFKPIVAKNPAGLILLR